MIENAQKPAVLDLRNVKFSNGVTVCYLESNGKVTDVSKRLRPFNFRVKPSQEMGNVYTWSDSY